MSNLEAYIIKKYGEWIPFDICSRELGFDVMQAIALTIKKSGSLNMKKEKMINGSPCLPKKNKITEYSYSLPVMPMAAVRSDSLRYIEFANLLDLNMHL